MRRATVDRELFRAAAPRLERAHRERREIRAGLYHERSHALGEVNHKEWLVEHRELSYLRSRDRSFVAAKQRKIDRARVELERAQARLVDIEERLRAA